MGLPKTPWPAEAKSEYYLIPILLQEMDHMIHVIHNQGLQGKRRNPHLITSLAPMIRHHCQELAFTLLEVDRLRPEGQAGAPPYWVQAIRIMMDDLSSMTQVYEDLEDFHDRRGNLAAALVLSKGALQGISYLLNTFKSIPPPNSRQTSPIEQPDVPEEWQELIDSLDLSGLPGVSGQ